MLNVIQEEEIRSALRCAAAHLCVLQVRMAKVKQVGLLAAGCQPWNKDVCAASGDRFAYCATLAIYIYQVTPPPPPGGL